MSDREDWRWTATLTLSRTDSSPNRRMFWNVRAIPARATLYAGAPVMSRPSNAIVPLVGRRNPDSRWNRVVLPAPLGPITPWIDRGASRSS